MLNTLQSINNFDNLLTYLGDELDWPIADYALDDLVFEYDADELGLKAEEAEKLEGGKIRQLRPLAGGQPFGIFFVEFGKKTLPIVVLRRILSQLIIKKRANAAEAKRWDSSDLLFISAYGESDLREIAFAHFHKEPNSPELPILRVLGWDGADTPLKLDYVDRELKHRLNWPDDTSDQDAWREKWRAAFQHKPGHVINTASALVETLAGFARKIRDAASTIIQHESEEKGHLRRLHRGFRDALIHDLTEEDFADTYAQTVTYGLLTAAVSRTDPSGVEGTALTTGNITDMVPVTNPFLKEMLEEFLKAGGRKGGIDFDELGIQDVVELLRDPKRTDLAAVLRDFGNKTQGEDPVIHFYEHFLAAYNKKLRIQRGVFYTPKPVVSYIVRSVNELLKTEFDLEDGLASTITWGQMLAKNPELELPPLTDEEGETQKISKDEFFVQILDPATGTATFPVEVIDVIHQHLLSKWNKGGLAAMPDLRGIPKETSIPKEFEDYWQHYVPLGLLPRLHAYELMMAPYAIAHMKIGLKLNETGYRFGSEERARIYLTNALEPKLKQLSQIGFDALAHEAAAVNEIKWHKRFTVIIGNPPYSGEGMNKGDWIRSLIDTYMYVDGAHLGEKGKKNWLQDDYVKFIRYAQFELDKTKLGILGFVTNHSFLDNPTFRGMRASLRQSFPRIHVLDMHGNSKKLQRGPDDNTDENVFDIQQGVSIGLFSRTPKTANSESVAHAHLWGLRGDASKTTRGGKYGWLSRSQKDSTDWNELSPDAPFYLFVPQDINLRNEYGKYWKLTDVMPHYGAGIITSRDHFVIDFEDTPLLKRLEIFRDKTVSDEEVRSNFEIKDNSMWSMEAARKAFQKRPIQNELFVDVLYRPYDWRRIYFETNVVFNMRIQVMRHLLNKDNMALITTRQTKEPWSILVSRDPVAHKATALYDVSSVFPQFLQEDDDRLSFDKNRRSNFSPQLIHTLSKKLGRIMTGLTPEDIFQYTYAVFHSPGYRSRYAEFLKIDFPRLPLTGNLELFRSLSQLGGELTALHLLESPKLDQPITEFIGSNTQVSKVIYTPDNGGTVWIDGKGTAKKPQAGTSGFASVPEEVWNFHIGGYQVCQKWLKDRGPKKGKPGRPLTTEDIAHYHKIVISLTETIRLMAEIDQVIESHGGWPDAFQTEIEKS